LNFATKLFLSSFLKNLRPDYESEISTKLQGTNGSKYFIYFIKEPAQDTK